MPRQITLRPGEHAIDGINAVDDGILGEADQWAHLVYAATALAFAVMMLTTTRGAVLATLCALPIGWLVAGRPASRQFVPVLSSCLIVAAVLVLLFQPYGDPATPFLRH